MLSRAAGDPYTHAVAAARSAAVREHARQLHKGRGDGHAAVLLHRLRCALRARAHQGAVPRPAQAGL